MVQNCISVYEKFLYFYFCRNIFSLGFGPFRWVCTSGEPADLAVTDSLALQVLEGVVNQGGKSD